MNPTNTEPKPLKRYRGTCTYNHIDKANYSAVCGSARASVAWRANSREGAGAPSEAVVPSCESSNGAVAVVGASMGACDGGCGGELAVAAALVVAAEGGIGGGGAW